MNIISIEYVLLIAGSLFLYYLINPKLRIAFLTILSCSLIALFNYYLLLYVVAFAGINFFIGLKIPASQNKKLLFRAGIVFCISQLVVLKYASFAIDPLFGMFNNSLRISGLSEILVPLGISYFTLQAIGYLINIKMNWEKPEKNFMNYLLYVTFYPKFISGPIERSNHFLPQLKVERSFEERSVIEGIKIVLFGFFKKIAIANQIAPFINDTYVNVNNIDGSTLWIVMILQPLYLYFDFSGYTDIAIGSAKIFGIDLISNFNRPFFSENMTNFWKRFHISLSSWFNDYIFKQTCFKLRKHGIMASIYALLLTWILFGIWHGAGWNFMLLGVLQAIAIIYEFFTKKWRIRLFESFPASLRIWLGRSFTFLFYAFSLTFFFAPDTDSTFKFFHGMFNFDVPIRSVILNFISKVPLSAVMLIFFFLAYELIQNDYVQTLNKINQLWSGRMVHKRVMRWVVYSSILAMLFVLGSQVQKFIYAQF